MLVGVNIVICCDIEVIVCPFDAVQIPSATHTHTHKRTHLFICTHIYVHIYTEVLKGHLNVCLQLGRSTGRGANTDRRHLGAHYHFRLIGEWAKCHASVSHGTKKTINYLRHLAHLAAIASQRPMVMERKWTGLNFHKFGAVLQICLPQSNRILFKKRRLNVL